jgi:hypothetical protein
MSRPKLVQLQVEVEEIITKFSSNRFLMAEAFLQIIHRENILTGNRIRKRHGEPEVIPEPVMYKENSNHRRVPTRRVEWIIDVPKSWYSLTGKE